MRIFLGVNLGLGFSRFSLGHHIFNCKGILGKIGISFTLRLLFWPRDPHITLFSLFEPLQSLEKGFEWWGVAREEEEEGLREEEEQLDPL